MTKHAQLCDVCRITDADAIGQRWWRRHRSADTPACTHALDAAARVRRISRAQDVNAPIQREGHAECAVPSCDRPARPRSMLCARCRALTASDPSMGTLADPYVFGCAPMTQFSLRLAPQAIECMTREQFYAARATAS